MKRLLTLFFLGIACSAWGVTSATLAQESKSVESSEDPFLWLEDVTGDKALDWVRSKNKIAQEKLEADPSFASLNADLLAILDSDARIPMVSKHGDFYYNFWRDKKNPRGLWRRTTLAEYEKPEPKWDVVLDLDAIGVKENENWVWGGAQILKPGHKRALLSLSRGGADAKVFREFDIETREFVQSGFQLEEAKGGVAWVDQDTVFVHTNFGEGSMTDSGYPRVTKLWKRGQKLADAKTIYEGQKTDMSVSAMHDDSPGFERNFVNRNIAFYNDELFYLKGESLIKIDAPNSANKGVFHEYIAFELREPWELDGKTYAAGSLLVGKFDDYMAGKRNLDVVFQPTEKTALSSYGFTKDFLYINVLEDVKNRIYVCKLGDVTWNKTPLVGAPHFGTVGIGPVDPDESNDYFLTATDYLTPTTLSMGEVGKEPKKLKSLPSFFDSTDLTITQNFANSKDGTKVPYFMVAKKDLKLDGKNPTFLYG